MLKVKSLPTDAFNIVGVIHRGVERGEILAPALKELGRPEGQNLVALVALCG
jgi:hypothetical protein